MTYYCTLFCTSFTFCLLRIVKPHLFPAIPLSFILFYFISIEYARLPFEFRNCVLSSDKLYVESTGLQTSEDNACLACTEFFQDQLEKCIEKVNDYKSQWFEFDLELMSFSSNDKLSPQGILAIAL